MSTFAVVALTLVFAVLVFGFAVEFIENHQQEEILNEEKYHNAVKRVLKQEIKNIEKDKSVSV